MSNVLIIHESEALRAELTHELLGEGFSVTQVDSSLAAVREIWQGTFVAALIGERLPGMTGRALEEQIQNLAPEILTVRIGRKSPARLARMLAEQVSSEAAA